MDIYLYDGSFEGFLTAVFEAYKKGAVIRKENTFVPDMFATTMKVETDLLKADRVWAGLSKKLSADGLHQYFSAFLSELEIIEDQLLSYTRHVFENQVSVEHDFGNAFVLFVAQTARKVHREKHRMEAFVRFQLTKDDIYFSLVSPDYNVLPLIIKHFKDRYADQRWMIYDKARNYGIYYDLEKVDIVWMEMDKQEGIWVENEADYQALWQTYYKGANIAGRVNRKLQLQHMPKRYWKYLPELR